MFKLALKDLRLVLSDKRGMLLGFALPIALISLFAYAFGGVGKSSPAPKPREVVIADGDSSPFSKMLIRHIDSMPEFTVLQTTSDSAREMVKKGERAAVLLIGPGSGDSISRKNFPGLEFLYDEAEGPSTTILQSALYNTLASIIEPLLIPDSIRPLNLQPQHRKTFIRSVPVVAEQGNSPGLIQAVAGTSIMMMLFSVSAIGAGLLDEKSEGTLKRLLYSPVTPNGILLGKMLFANIMSIAQLTVMFLFAWVAFGLQIIPVIIPTFLMILCTAFACSSFGVFLASLARTRVQVQGLSTLIVLVMSAVGGSMVPSFVMPEFMQKISVLSVNYWGIQGFYDIFWRQLSLSDPVFLQRLIVLLVIGGVFNGIALMLFRRNLFNLH
ncbi:MAG: ABC transporter permease [Bacteroidia bacterium]|nr:ABC transporter permease [Bacteroidia bacterium]